MIEPDLTVKQVAQLFGVTNTIIYRLIKSGQLEAYRVGTGKQRPAIRITAQSVNEYRQKNRIRPQEDTTEKAYRREANTAA
jgi:excisionase family DNA binding protein